jgi:nitrate reductase gamma subunit
MTIFVLGIILGMALVIAPAVLIIRRNKKKFQRLYGDFKREAQDKVMGV